nr:MAG TPA_asm: hypothetical protein [Caudoviricetes sp.]
MKNILELCLGLFYMQIKKIAKQLIKRLILPNKQNKITKMVNLQPISLVP